ncbi:coiled-coil-helix-coiled-coil-helix domain containing 3a isoform X1, partial [Tachysurus ichikawai]
AKQLEERDQQLRKQDAFYREQLNKLEERENAVNPVAQVQEDGEE